MTTNAKILLINPPNKFKSPVLPIGLASIAAYLQSKDIRVSAIDAWAESINGQELENRICQTKADIIGIYMISPCYNAAKATIELARRALPDSIIIAGGPHPSAVPTETLNEIKELDICVIGEGEIIMHELVKSFQNGSELSAVDGIAYRDAKNGEIIITKPRAFIKDLDALPLPARELFPIDKYRAHPPLGRKKPYLTTITSRGCPYQCAFCSKDVFKDNYRAMSPKKVCDEIEELISKYHAQEIQFYDDDFTVNMQRAEEICDEILRRNLKFSWSCITRVNLVNEKLLKKMKEAGCWYVAYGVESGNQQILDSINKGFTINQITTAFEMTRKIGLTTSSFFLAGLPGETKETIQQSLDLAKKIKPDFIGWGILIVYPGSRLFKLIQSGKYQGRLKTLNKGANLTGTFFSQGDFTVFEDNLTFEQMKEIIKKAQIEFYLRPQYILQCLKSMRSFSDFTYYLNGVIKIIKLAAG